MWITLTKQRIYGKPIEKWNDCVWPQFIQTDKSVVEGEKKKRNKFILHVFWILFLFFSFFSRFLFFLMKKCFALSLSLSIYRCVLILLSGSLIKQQIYTRRTRKYDYIIERSAKELTDYFACSYKIYKISDNDT